MRLIVYVALGGMAGTLARYGLQGLVQQPTSTFPWGTLLVNLSGSFALGFLMRYLLGSTVATPEIRAALTVGFCGAFTTMSSFSYEAMTLLNHGQYWRAVGYGLASVGGSVMAVFAGTITGQKLL